MLRKKIPISIWSILGSVWACLSIARLTIAQIVPDATLPVNSIVLPQGNTYVIEGGTQAGGNLFHSFSEFSLPTGTEAFFNNSLDIQNIFSRVTGSSISNIDGLIRANGTASLFLINPNGIIFGPHSQLKIGGSFFGSTASSLKFADGVEFSTTNTQTSPLLTVSLPVGLQFGSNPGAIEVNGPGHHLNTNPQTGKIDWDNRNAGLHVFGQTLALVGGEVTLAGGNLTADTGSIELGSVGAGSLVNLATFPSVNGSSWVLNYENVENFRDIRLVQEASVVAIGSKGGDIQVWGRRITLSDGSVVMANTIGSRPGGNSIVNATETMQIIGSSTIGNVRSSLLADTYSTGNGGNLTINTGSLLVKDGAVVSASTYGAGKAGNLTVNASEQVQAIGVSADGLRPSALFARADRGSTGSAGDLTINTARLLLQDGGQVGAGTLSSGRGGNLTINASELVQLSGISANRDFPSALGSRAAINSTGDAGNLTINTGVLIVRESARVGARGLGQGNGGTVSINAGSILLDNEGFISADSQGIDTDNREQATINVRAGNLILRQNSSISTNARGKNAIGGNINIESDVIAALGNSDISANSQNFRGGQVRINTRGILGTEFRSISTSGSDITATGGTPELRGTVEIDRTEVEPSSRLIELPSNLTDITARIAATCPASQGNRFAIVGRGGLPPDPSQTLTGQIIWRDLRPLPQNARSRQPSRFQFPIPSSRIVEARGWMLNSKGEVELVTQALNSTIDSSNLIPHQCFLLQNKASARRQKERKFVQSAF